MKEDLVETIMKEPQAPIILKTLQNRLKEEQKKRQEFYDLEHQGIKAEFINGEIIVHSPVKKMHTNATGKLYKLLDTFVEKWELGFVGFEKTMTVFTRNDYEPDICFFNIEKSKNFTDNQSRFPIPDLIVEVLSSDKKRDRMTKYGDYEAHGVAEYWIIDPKEKTVEQYILVDKKYELNIKAKDGTIQSKVVMGFTIPIKAIFYSKENQASLLNILMQQ